MPQQTDMHRFVLHPAGETDRHFIYDCFLATLKRHVEWQRGWDEETECDKFWRHHPIDKLQLVLVDDQPAGCLYVERQPDHFHLHMIMVLPQLQSRGLGTALLQQMMATARNSHLPLRLGVIKSNPARQLYDRLGFVVCGETDTAWQMQWTP